VINGATTVRLSAEVVELVKLRMVFAQDQGVLLDIEQWLQGITVLSDQGDYYLMVLKDKN
jgi:hypothetical protein